jgi:predicted AAA+ superfamily ATPase
MKPFTAIAIPHKDILEGRFSLDVYAPDLMKVYKGEAPDEYQNPNVFFSRTYITAGMKNLFDVVKNRIDGKGGDPIIQLQTPFGGGKTHSLIALYHKVKEEWKSNLVVIDGTAYDPKEITLWEEIERQLTEKITLLKGQTAPGKEKLTKLLEKYQPLLILMDEVLQYIIKAAGVKVGSTTLAE